MNIVVFGLSITSTWGNGHATTYRSLLRALAARGHEIIFLERDVEWYANRRDLAQPDFCRLGLYQTLEDLDRSYRAEIQSADFIIDRLLRSRGRDAGRLGLSPRHWTGRLL